MRSRVVPGSMDMVRFTRNSTGLVVWMPVTARRSETAIFPPPVTVRAARFGPLASMRYSKGFPSQRAPKW